MKTIGIIAELNPFHNGHAYLIQQAKKETGADFCIVAMSGDFVQRGAPALLSKYTRAQIALEHGADCVLELPVTFATSSAEGFARAGVKLLSQTGLVDVLCFGSEGNAAATLHQAASLLSNESVTFKACLQQGLSSGMSYPQARMQALLSEFSLQDDTCNIDQLGAQLSSPNNVLGMEYIKAIQQLDVPLSVHTIGRRGTAFHSEALDQPFASATAIRTLLLSEASDAAKRDLLANQIPAQAQSLLFANQDSFLSEEDCYGMLLYQLLSTGGKTESSYLDVPPWLSNRIEHVWQKSHSFEELIQLCKSKNITYTAVSRALCHILLQIPQTLFDTFHPIDQTLPYIKVLGCRKNAMSCISKVIPRASVPWILRMTDGQQLDNNPAASALFHKDIQASQLYQSIRSCTHHHTMENEFQRKFLLI